MLTLPIILAVFAYLALRFRHWMRSSPRFFPPLWRSKISFIGFAFGSASCLLYLATIAVAIGKGGFRYYDPLLLNIYGVGLVTASIGFVLSIPGKGKLHVPAILSSLLMLAMWFLTASFE